MQASDFAGALTRALGESAAYDLLGYAPSKPPDGKWRKLQIRVARSGVKVRARRGYFAASETP